MRKELAEIEASSRRLAEIEVSSRRLARSDAVLELELAEIEEERRAIEEVASYVRSMLCRAGIAPARLMHAACHLRIL